MKVISTTCTVDGKSAYGDATLENGSIPHWVAVRSVDSTWETATYGNTGLDAKTVRAIKEAALAAIKEKEKS